MHPVKCLVMVSLLLSMVHANEVLINTQDGKTLVFDVDPEESLRVLQERVAHFTDDTAYIVAFSPTRNKEEWDLHVSHQGGYIGHPRDYSVAVMPHEKADIHYIVSSLADKSLITIALIKGDLEAAGDRIDHVHPLRFLMTVFTDEEMKVGVRNIRGRGWIWNHFVSGLKESLVTEMHLGNLTDDFIHHFAETVELDVNRIYPYVQTHNWDGFIDVLINEIPRKGNHDRYDN